MINSDNKVLMKAKKIRIYPSEIQKGIIRNNFRCNMFVWNNYFNMIEANYIQGSKYLKLHEKDMSKEEIKKFKRKMFPSRFDLIKMLPKLKKHYSWLKKGEATSFQYSITHLRQAYERLFKGIGKHPKRKYSVNSYTSVIPSNVKAGVLNFDKHLIKLNKLGNIFYVTTKGFRIDPMKIKNITVSENNLHNFFASITYEYTVPDVNISSDYHFKAPVGIDMGIADLMILSTGKKIPYINFEPMTKKLHYQISKMSRRQLNAQEYVKNYNELHANDSDVAKITLEDCNSYKKQKHIVGKQKKTMMRKRDYYLQQITNELVKEHDLIVIENLKSANMMKNHHLAKSIGNASWYKIRTMLEYKCEEKNKKLVIVQPHNTSRICSKCGADSGAKPLKIRQWTCPSCHTQHDRDINAAKNILSRGMKQLDEEE